MNNFIKFILILSLGFAAYKYFYGGGTSTSIRSSSGKGAPEITASGWINTRQPISLKACRGRVVVVEFWATWCPPCRQSIPHLKQLYSKYQRNGVVFVSLTSESASTVKTFARDYAMTYPIGYGSNSSNVYGVNSIPRAFVINKQGAVSWQGHPMSGLDEAIKAALQ